MSNQRDQETDKETSPNETMHLCLLGPSGIGKSPLANLFKLEGFEPYRIRTPRDEKDKRVCMDETEAEEIYNHEFNAHRPEEIEEDWLEVGNEYCFFSVRKDRQCLRFKIDGKRVLNKPKRIEIFAPRLLDILKNKKGSGAAIGLNLHNILLIFLNPSTSRYSEMNTPDNVLEQATFYAITKRTELQRKPVDLADAFKRIKRLSDELAAWKDLQGAVPKYVECTKWKHYEFRYLQPDNNPWNANRELVSTRETLITAFEKSGHHLFKQLVESKVIRSVEQVLQLSDIV